MTSKKYVAWLLSILILFVLINLAFWHGLVKEIFIQGDLSRLGSFKVNKTVTPHKKFLELHTELSGYLKAEKKKSFDIITIGDSFSQGHTEVFYQDILENKYGFKVLNVNLTYAEKLLGDLYNLNQSGLLDEIKPRYVIIESVARAVNLRLGLEEISQEGLTLAQVEKLALKMSLAQKASLTITSGIFPSIMFQANMKFLEDLKYRMENPENLSASTFCTELDRDLFTNEGQENLLLYYFQDLDYLTNSINIDLINKNLNNAAEILAKKNIKLIFMPCVDKFDLYFPYIKKKNGRPENNLFEEFRKIPDKNYIFIDTKKFLREALENNEKDLYWLNDTHWSWRGMSIICEKIFESINDSKLISNEK